MTTSFSRMMILMMVAVLLVANRMIEAKELGMRAAVVRSSGETTVDSKKNLQFFRRFGSHLNRNKFNRALECDYDHPENSGFCPPVGDVHPFQQQQQGRDGQPQGQRRHG